jgi:hypothetical protein
VQFFFTSLLTDYRAARGEETSVSKGDRVRLGGQRGRQFQPYLSVVVVFVEAIVLLINIVVVFVEAIVLLINIVVVFVEAIVLLMNVVVVLKNLGELVAVVIVMFDLFVILINVIVLETSTSS